MYADGQVDLVDLMPGDYELRAWHPRHKATPMASRITVREGDRLAQRLSADIVPQPKVPGS